jgi:hypothetical protein
MLREFIILYAAGFLVFTYLTRYPPVEHVQLERVELGAPWRACRGTEEERQAVQERMQWGELPFEWFKEKVEPRNAYMVKRKAWTPIDQSGLQRLVHGGAYAFLPRHYLNLMGPITYMPLDMVMVGEDADQQRLVQWRPDQDVPGCVFHSMGSNNQFDFEEGLLRLTRHCVVHVFDCTVEKPAVPAHLKSRLVFHKLCVGAGHTPFDALVEMTNPPVLVKMDVEGHEWSALLEVLESPNAPEQVAVEVHYAMLPWSYGIFEPREVLAYFNRVFHKHGYALSWRRDNPQCKHCADITLIKIKC